MRFELTILVLGCVLAPWSHAARDSIEPPSIGVTAPQIPRGVSIVPLEQQPVPDLLKNQARAELAQMKSQGYVYASEERVSYLSKAKNDQERLRPWPEVVGRLKMRPASLHGTQLESSALLGATSIGGSTSEQAAGVFRLFSTPRTGLASLEEVDLVESAGGWAMIKEAINQEINGQPAILTIYQGPRGSRLVTISWATGRKLYTLSADHTANSAEDVNDLLTLARTIVD
jgi:hypothetical protein